MDKQKELIKRLEADKKDNVMTQSFHELLLDALIYLVANTVDKR